jgi:exonuclease SbcC
LEKRISELKEEIENKTKLKKQMEQYARLEGWISGFFTNLMGTIEKHVMLNIRQEFDALFEKWFSMLVPDENLSVRIDEEFSPVVEQDGFETEYSFLSGGEKTAIALAYRLALNKVINDLIDTIKTKDLIILDEPTDGFSTEQMDAMRDVLHELDNRQTVIVSHESKIESFVKNTIRFSKENHVSRVES